MSLIIVSKDEWLKLSINDILKREVAAVDGLDRLPETEEPFVILIDAVDYNRLDGRELVGILARYTRADIILILDKEGIAYAQLPTIGRLYSVIKEHMDRELPLLLCRISDDRQERESMTIQEKEDILVKEEKTGVFNESITRRSFLKGAAATAAAVGVVVSGGGNLLSPLAEATGGLTTDGGEQIFTGQCRPNCFGGCVLNVHVRDGKVVKTSARDLPDPRYTRICLKGLTHMERIYDPDRLKYPMKRVGERGAGQWERISWEEAITTITDNWEKTAEQYGKSANAFWLGSGSWGSLSGRGPGDTKERMISLLGATNIDQSYDMAFCWIVGQLLGNGFCSSFNEPADMVNAKTIIVWGNNLAESQVQTWHFIADAIENGAKLVVIDPIFTETAAKAHQYVPVRPGSDGALAMAMCNVVIEEGLTDTDFLMASSDAPYLVKESDGKFLRLSDIRTLDGNEDDAVVVRDGSGNADVPANIADPVLSGSFTINGHKVTTVYDMMVERVAAYTPEMAEGLCDVPADTIRELARLYATNTPGTIYHGYGMDHYVNGHSFYAASISMAILTGNLGKPGAAAGWCYCVGTTVLNPSGVPLPSGYEAVRGPVVASPNLPEVMETKKYNGDNLEIKSVYVYNVNPLGNTTQRTATLEALKKMDMIVVSDMVMSDTALYADILLPVAHWFENQDLCFSNTQHPFVTYQEKAIDPLYECKPEYEISCLLAEKMGLSECFPSEEKYMEGMLDWEGARSYGITVDKLKEEKVMRGWEENAVHGKGGVFPTTDGRAHMYVEEIIPRIPHGQAFDANKESMAYFDPPAEAWPENKLYEKYPLVFVQQHSRWRTHSQWAFVETLRELDPEPLVYINPEDAAKRGIKTGDSVRVYNDRGYMVIKAATNNGVRKGVVDVPKGWQEKQFIEGHYQDLTSNVSHPMCENNAFYDTLVEVIKEG